MAEKDALIEDRHAPSDKGAPIARGDDKPAVIHIPKNRTKTVQYDLTRFRVSRHHTE